MCRQSRQQLEEEQKRSLDGLDGTGKVSGPSGPLLPLCGAPAPRFLQAERPWALLDLGEEQILWKGPSRCIPLSYSAHISRTL